MAVLAAIVGIHECGHFIAARAQGIHVTKFSIGFGPPLLSYQVQDSECPPSRQYLCSCEAFYGFECVGVGMRVSCNADGDAVTIRLSALDYL